jgi:hypothetical protein
MPLTKQTAPLDPKTQATIDEARPLSTYRLRFANPDYPMLSLVYAIYAGGEHALYCDHGGDFFRAYMVDPIVEAARVKAQAAIEAVADQSDQIIAATVRNARASVEAARSAAMVAASTVARIVGPLIEKRKQMAHLPPEKQEAILPTEQDVDAFLVLVRAELVKQTLPTVPPLPMW